MDAITEQSAVALAAAIRSGQTTAREVVEAHIELLVRVNPMINAVIADRYDAARREADAADARIAAAEPGESLPPLLGVPCTVKESLALAGMPHSAGVVARQGQRATTTATVVARAMNAGAIPLGVTNTSELCLWVESENRLYGRTRNPYDPSRIAGGSSGGEAAAIGSGGSPFGLGSDIGGSIWIPAFCCGVFGHKPSRGLVPATGAWPPLSGDSGRLYSNGPLARRAEDLMPLLRVMAGPDGVDRQTIPVRLGDPAEVSLGGLTVLLTDDAWLVAPSDELLAARERAAGALAAAGARIRRRRMPALRRAVDAYVTTLARSTGVAVRAQARVPARVASRLVAAGRLVAHEIAAAVGDGVLLHPPLARTAFRHGRTVGRPWHLAHAVPFNLAGVPATQVPLGLGQDGLPVGVQVVAGYLRDHVAIAVALELERVFGGWVPPPRLRRVAFAP